MSEIEIPRPTSGDVLERILEDHRLFEDLLRLARRNDTDREAARHALAEVLVAHATAEEEKVYPTLRTDRAISAHEEEHGTVVNHHSNEEEQTIINPARDDVSLEERERLGVAWLTRRNQLLEQGCASEEQVAAKLDEAVGEGVLAPEEAREEADEIEDEAKKKAKAV